MSVWDRIREKAKKRIAVCQKCDEYDGQKAVCNKCGCNMNVKTLYPLATCPLNKWPEPNNEEQKNDSKE